MGRSGDVVNFSGYIWDVKIAESYQVGPGPNYFSGYYEDVFVDEQGYLHMRIAEHDGKWFSSEVVSQMNMGYGKYSWVVQGDLENIPENITLGLFTWDNNTFFDQANSEVDIEFSKWGVASEENTMLYSVQPVNFGPTYPERTHLIETEVGDLVGVTTHTFIWTDTLITWNSYYGDTESEDKRIGTWYFNLDNPPRVKNENGNSSAAIVIPAPGETTNSRINFWLLPWISSSPTDGLEREMVIRKFSYEAAE
ncbi:MAG TPA: hypothetical protein PKN40_02940 [Chitinophagales bacterium]|nr:hypothetical protein [Chitinophagales bacterium]